MMENVGEMQQCTVNSHIATQECKNGTEMKDRITHRRKSNDPNRVQSRARVRLGAEPSSVLQSQSCPEMHVIRDLAKE